MTACIRAAASVIVLLLMLIFGCLGPEPDRAPLEEAPAPSAPPPGERDTDPAPEAEAPTPEDEPPPPPEDTATQEFPAGERDVFGTRALYPTAPQGRTWAAKWDEHPRTLSAPQMDPYDAEFHVRGAHQKLEIQGNGLARSWGELIRLYIGTWGRTWLNTELTVYAMHVAEQEESLATAGFEFQTRTADGHRTEFRLNRWGLDKRCDGHAYSYTLSLDGQAMFQKELKHPFYTPKLTTSPWGGQPLPRNQWVGIKVITYNLPDKAVKLELWVDLTDGEHGGTWEKVHEYTDAGGWSIPEEAASSCEIAPDHRIISPQPFVILRNSGVREQWFKKLTVREIQPP